MSDRILCWKSYFLLSWYSCRWNHGFQAFLKHIYRSSINFPIRCILCLGSRYWLRFDSLDFLMYYWAIKSMAVQPWYISILTKIWIGPFKLNRTFCSGLIIHLTFGQICICQPLYKSGISSKSLIIIINRNCHYICVSLSNWAQIFVFEMCRIFEVWAHECRFVEMMVSSIIFDQLLVIQILINNFSSLFIWELRHFWLFSIMCNIGLLLNWLWSWPILLIWLKYYYRILILRLYVVV